MRRSKFFLGFVALILALNGASYFYWSAGWGNLLGPKDQHAVGIGFPWLIWHNGIGYPAPILRIIGLILNLFVGIFISSGLAILVPRRFISTEPTKTTDPVGENWFRFSLKELLLLTALMASILAVAGDFFGSPVESTLKVIYLMGPCVIFWWVYGLREFPTWIRSTVVFAISLGMVVAAAITAEQSPVIRDFTKGLMGIFVCWTPQLLFVAAGLILFGEWAGSKIPPESLLPKKNSATS